MGGLFKAPKPVVIAPSTTTSATTTTADATAAAEEAAAASRTEARSRATRGMVGTIATSNRGLLGARADFAATRKSLLGE